MKKTSPLNVIFRVLISTFPQITVIYRPQCRQCGCTEKRRSFGLRAAKFSNRATLFWTINEEVCLVLDCHPMHQPQRGAFDCWLRYAVLYEISTDFAERIEGLISRIDFSKQNIKLFWTWALRRKNKKCLNSWIRKEDCRWKKFWMTRHKFRQREKTKWNIDNIERKGNLIWTKILYHNDFLL